MSRRRGPDWDAAKHGMSEALEKFPLLREIPRAPSPPIRQGGVMTDNELLEAQTAVMAGLRTRLEKAEAERDRYRAALQKIRWWVQNTTEPEKIKRSFPAMLNAAGVDPESL